MILSIHWYVLKADYSKNSYLILIIIHSAIITPVVHDDKVK